MASVTSPASDATEQRRDRANRGQPLNRTLEVHIMKSPPTHRRMLAAVMLLAFVIAAIVAGLFALASPDQSTAAQLATVAIVAVVAAAVIVAATKKRDETLIETALTMLSTAASAIMLVVGIAPNFRTAMAGPDIDVGSFRQRHLTNRRTQHVNRRHRHGNDFGTGLDPSATSAVHQA